jgi:addiction module RelE/StbE family toxin
MDRMRVRWLSPALAELDRVYEYISPENPKAARQVFTRIRKSTERLKRFAEAGREGHVPGTRELPVTGLPYLVVYRVIGDTVEVLRVLHTSQNRSDPLH